MVLFLRCTEVNIAIKWLNFVPNSTVVVLLDLTSHASSTLSHQVLKMDENNVKAFFRRGKARHSLGQTEQAAEDLEAAIKRYVPGMTCCSLEGQGAALCV